MAVVKSPKNVKKKKLWVKKHFMKLQMSTLVPRKRFQSLKIKKKTKKNSYKSLFHKYILKRSLSYNSMLMH